MNWSNCTFVFGYTKYAIINREAIGKRNYKRSGVSFQTEGVGSFPPTTLATLLPWRGCVQVGVFLATLARLAGLD